MEKTTIKKWKELLQRFQDNHELYNQQNEALRLYGTRKEWYERYQNSSNKTRELFQDNENILKEMEALLEEDLDDELADALYESLAGLYLDGIDDYRLMMELGHKLVAFYEAKDDVDKLLLLYRLIAFEKILMHGLCMSDAEKQEVLSYYQKSLSFKNRYAEIKTEDSRSCIFNAYGNMIAPIGYRYPEMRDQMVGIYRDVQEFWNRADVQALDGESEHIKQLVSQMDEDFLFVMIEYIDSLTEDEKNVIIEIADRVKQNQDDDSAFVFHATVIAGMLTEEITPKDALDQLFEHLIQDRPTQEMTEDGYRDEDFEKIVNYHSTSEFFFQILKFANLPIEEELEFTDFLLPELIKVFSSIPYDFFTSTMNYISAEWYQSVAYFLDNFEEKWRFLEKTVILRQPSTYIHSLMVSKIAELIAQEIILVDPGLFCGVRSYATVRDVVKWKRALLEYVVNCGLLHDIGKCTLLQVINQQTRKINNEEFAVIKNHTTAGITYLQEDPMFADYFDVIKGHHKFYDGKAGYPAGYNNNESKNKFVVDIITISDCMDAALDRLGRNYSAGKAFDVLLEEFKAGAGTRYNPDIVRIISESPTLREKLEELTGPGRIDVYYQAYETIYMNDQK